MHANLSETQRSLQLLYEPGDCVELRAFNARATLNGYYKNLQQLAADACQLNSELQPPAQCYVVLNPVLPALHSKRADECWRCGKGDGTKDSQVVCRKWLLVDCDPVKPDRGISATDQERAATEQLAKQVYRYLTTECGLPAPVVATSGNGFWLLLRLADFANDNCSRWALRRFLVLIADRFDNRAAVVDRTTFNAAQLVKLLGTVARRGSNTAERPHRLSQVLSVPKSIVPITWEQLTAITGAPPADNNQSPAAMIPTDGACWNIEQLLIDRQIEYTEDREYVSASGECATRYELVTCPWEPEHSRSAFIIQFASGAVAAGCLGNRCAGKGWPQLKETWGLPNGSGITAKDIILPAQARQPADLVIVRSQDVLPEPIAWLWQDRFVIGGVNLCAGRGGIGKTYFLCDLVSRITNPALCAPNGQPLRHGRVLYSTGEDHISKVIEPRMRQHGVDRSRLEYIKGIPAGRYVQLLDVIANCDLMRDALRQRPDTIALVLDPISSFQGDLDSNKVTSVRRFTAVLTQLSEEFNIAVIGIHHFNKGKREIAGDSISGSHAYRDAARSIWLFALDDNDPGRRLMVCDKHNWAEQRPLGLAYRIEAGRIQYEAEPLDMTADELLVQGTQKSLDIACAWLVAQLSTGPQSATNIQIAATVKGIPERTLNRAKKCLSIVSTKDGNRWIWSLPTATEQLK